MKTRKFGTLEIWGSRMAMGLVRVKRNPFVLSVKHTRKAVPSSIRLKYTVVIRMKNSWERH